MRSVKDIRSGFEFGKSVIENLTAMSAQRDFEEVKSECNAGFFDEIDGEVYDADPLRSALDHAVEYDDVKCLVVQDSWFMIVPSRKKDPVGWLNCLKIWESIDEQRRIKAVSK